MSCKLFHPNASNTLVVNLACVARHKRLKKVYSAVLLENLHVFSTSCKVPGCRRLERYQPKAKEVFSLIGLPLCNHFSTAGQIKLAARKKFLF